MSRLEIACVTMHQTDFSKLEQMNIQSDVIFANQCNHTGYEEHGFRGFTAKMISTQTRGVGINRNLSMMYATGEIVLFSDDDMCYRDGYAQAVLEAFDNNPVADVIIFNIDTIGGRPQKKNTKTKRLGPWARMPYGAPRVAVRLEALKRSNVWFTTLFGGGSRYTNGEDSLFLHQLRKAGLRFYVSNAVIGTVDMQESTWYQGATEEFFFNKGVYISAAHPKMRLCYDLYFLFRVHSSLGIVSKWKWLSKGNAAFAKGTTFREIVERTQQ